MHTTDLYDAIFKRKSIRRLESTPLDEDTLRRIRGNLTEPISLYGDIGTELRILPENSVTGLFGVKAPHYLALFSERREGYLTNAGFILQQMDLYLSANGVGSCWLGAARPSRRHIESSELSFVISLAFGRPSGSIHRGSPSEFRRLPLESIRDATGVDDLLEPARLAPSASNSQPWFFTGDPTRINVYVSKPNLLSRLSLVDGGIAISHIWIAATHKGKKIQTFMDHEAARDPPQGKLYVTTLKLT